MAQLKKQYYGHLLTIFNKSRHKKTNILSDKFIYNSYVVPTFYWGSLLYFSPFNRGESLTITMDKSVKGIQNPSVLSKKIHEQALMANPGIQILALEGEIHPTPH